MLLLTPHPSHEEQEMTHRSASKASPLGLQQMIQEAPAALVERYLAMGIVVSHVFIDVVQYWIGRKEQLPGHYHMAMDFLRTPATSAPSEQVNSMAGREFTTARQSLSTDIFIKTMCLRSWMKAGIIKVPVDRQIAY